MWATFIQARDRQGAAASFITPTQTLVLLPGKTTFSQEKTELFTATTGKMAVGQAIVETGGSPSIGRSQNCRISKNCATKARNAHRTSNHRAASVARAFVEGADDAKPHSPSYYPELAVEKKPPFAII
jgi:hypothetical protein